MAARKILSLVVIFLFCICANSPASEKVLVVTDEWAPYVYSEDDTLKGFDYEVMMAVFADMGCSVIFKLYPWKRCIHLIESKQADAILDIDISEERKKKMYYPDEKMSDSASVLFHLKGKKYVFNTLQDLKGLKIGTILGYMYSKEIDDTDIFLKEPVANLDINFNKLKLGRIDMFISNRNVGLFKAKKLSVLNEITYLDKTISGGANYLAFSMKKRNRALVTTFSNRLKAFKGTVEYKAILKKYGQESFH